MKRKYAVCGVSNRAIGMFIKPMIATFSSTSELVGLLDPDPRRFEVCKSTVPAVKDVPQYGVDQFEQMVQDMKPDCIIVAGRDDTHVAYIIKALELNLDVICEKPMATTAADCKRIIDAEAKSEGKVIVTFNYRYAPIHTKIKALVAEGKVGRVTHIDLNWYIDTYHGSSYFKRWNRDRELSGGLSIHKSSHHFDLVRWWIDQQPIQAFSYGDLHYYGADGELKPRRADGSTSKEPWDNMYHRRWSSRSDSLTVKDNHIGSVGFKGEAYTNYSPDQFIFDDEIDIEDVYTATVKYDGGALLSYSCNFSTPYEGYRLAINGTKGRIETMEYHAPSRVPFPTPVQVIDYYPLFESKETIHVVHREGGHGGGDPILLEDLFLGEDPYHQHPILSGSVDGAYAVATGEAVWRSVKENKPINIADLLS